MLFVFVLGIIMILWRPSSNRARYVWSNPHGALLTGVVLSSLAWLWSSGVLALSFDLCETLLGVKAINSERGARGELICSLWEGCLYSLLFCIDLATKKLWYEYNYMVIFSFGLQRSLPHNYIHMHIFFFVYNAKLEKCIIVSYFGWDWFRMQVWQYRNVNFASYVT